MKRELNDKELENISEKHDFTSCKKCNIFRPKRTHHCRYCNKCILDMDHHCFSLNKCIGKNNYNIYIKYLIFVELNTSLKYLKMVEVFSPMCLAIKAYKYLFGIYNLLPALTELSSLHCLKSIIVFSSLYYNV